jgi:hypothetical protein
MSGGQGGHPVQRSSRMTRPITTDSLARSSLITWIKSADDLLVPSSQDLEGKVQCPEEVRFWSQLTSRFVFVAVLVGFRGVLRGEVSGLGALLAKSGVISGSGSGLSRLGTFSLSQFQFPNIYRILHTVRA